MNEREKHIYDLMASAHHPQVNSIVVWEKGGIKAECYFNGFNAKSRHVIQSVVKSIISIGIGAAQDEGMLNVNDKILKYLPEFAEQRDLRHRLIKIEHLLTMTSGIYWQGGVHYHCPMMQAMRRSGNWVGYIADCMVKDMPGTVYNYKEFDVILLSAILSKVTGDAFDYINDKLFLPLGISNERWYQSPDGVYYSPALEKEFETASALTAIEMVKIGQLFLQKGEWNGKRIISEAYIESAIRPSPANPGYGYLWWLGEGWYGARGFGGQTITVFPEKEKIVVTQASVTDRPLSYDDIYFAEI